MKNHNISNYMKNFTIYIMELKKFLVPVHHVRVIVVVNGVLHQIGCGGRRMCRAHSSPTHAQFGIYEKLNFELPNRVHPNRDGHASASFHQGKDYTLPRIWE